MWWLSTAVQYAGTGSTEHSGELVHGQMNHGHTLGLLRCLRWVILLSYQRKVSVVVIFFVVVCYIE